MLFSPLGLVPAPAIANYQREKKNMIIWKIWLIGYSLFSGMSTCNFRRRMNRNELDGSDEQMNQMNEREENKFVYHSHCFLLSSCLVVVERSFLWIKRTRLGFNYLLLWLSKAIRLADGWLSLSHRDHCLHLNPKIITSTRLKSLSFGSSYRVITEPHCVDTHFIFIDPKSSPSALRPSPTIINLNEWKNIINGFS